MTPSSPVIPGSAIREVVIAKDQPQYLPLPAVIDDSIERAVTTRWRLTFMERLRVLLHGDIWLQQLTFGTALQPVMLTTVCPQVIENTE